MMTVQILIICFQVVVFQIQHNAEFENQNAIGQTADKQFMKLDDEYAAASIFHSHHLTVNLVEF